MNAVIENMKVRRSYRKYKSEMIDEEIIKQICEAGSYAPTGRNLQSPIIIAVTNKEERDHLQKMNAAVMGATGDPFYGAPVILIVLANKDVPTYVYDGSLVMANLMLAAESLDIGSCWIHRAKEEFESEEGKELLKKWGIEGNYEGIGHVILGYKDEQPAPKTYKENYITYIK